jgi:hypothetical protein
MGNQKNKEQMAGCSVGKIFMELENVMGKKSKFFEHMTRSRIEFLKGIRSLLDERIDHYEKKGFKKAGKKMTKIKVE